MSVKIACPNPLCDASYSGVEEFPDRIGRCEKCGSELTLAFGTEERNSLGSVTELDSLPNRGAPIEVDLPSPFGRYVIIRLLGRGGMGAVYLAHDSQLDRAVALKVPHREFAQNASVRERFLREARAAARFHHPNFCPIHDIGEIDGIPYLTMAYIEGGTLASAIERGQPWDQRKAAEIVRQLAVALGEAHRQGIVHRDLKPANVMMDSRGGLVLMDFGLARRFEGDDPTLTAAGTVMGTPGYMSPEQAEGRIKEIGPRSDVYSLGVMLYELISGRRPFEGTVVRVLAMILTAEPSSPSTHHPEVSPALEKICLKAMAKEIQDRYASMQDLAGALTAFLAAEAVLPLAVTPPTVTPSAVPLEPASGLDAIRSGPVKRDRLEGRTPRRGRSILTRVGVIALAAVLLLGILFATTNLGRTRVRVHPQAPGSPPRPDEPVITSEVLGLKLRLIPAGEFEMGSDASDPDAVDDETVNGKKHHVQLSRPFYLGATEVTVGQFRKFVEAQGYQTDAEQDGRGANGWDEKHGTFKLDRKFNWRSPGFPQQDDHPVVNVSWNDAQAFCEWLSKAEGQAYRLPTEAEWEYACRAGQSTRFSSGDAPDSLATVANVDDGTATAKEKAKAKEKHPGGKLAIDPKDGFTFTAPVGRFHSNDFGLLDMHGNVWEWCEDWFVQHYYAESPSIDPKNSSDGLTRVIRGGSWSDLPRDCRAANRNAGAPNNRSSLLGFRVARDR
jgi:formylglycine-generating enzyme required for sulfatase activity/predicted Ser/Thr protein kinase